MTCCKLTSEQLNRFRAPYFPCDKCCFVPKVSRNGSGQLSRISQELHDFTSCRV